MTRAQAKAEITNCVEAAGATAMQYPSGRTAAINCMKSHVPAGRQKALKTCLSHAAARDKLGTARGREAFESIDGPDCFVAVP